MHHVDRSIRYFLMRCVRPVLYFPVEMFYLFPGSVANEIGLKRKIIRLVVRCDKPLLALNRRFHDRTSIR